MPCGRIVSDVDNDFAKIRSGILEHLESGRIYTFDLSTYVILHLNADRSKGLVWSSASYLARVYGSADGQSHIEKWWFRDSLTRLESGNYIKRFAKARIRTSYPILIHKFIPTCGFHCGMMLNAIDSIDWQHPIYVRLPVDFQMTSSGLPVETSPNIGSRELELELEKPRPQNPRALPPHQDRKSKIENRNYRLSKEAEVRREAHVGMGPDVQQIISELAAKKKV